MKPNFKAMLFQTEGEQSMSLMSETLERISVYCHLTKPGRRIEEIERQLNFFPFKLSDEVYEFYQWTGAPTGDRSPDGWDGSYNDNSTYHCVLERFLGNSGDLIHFLSIEETEKYYSVIDADRTYLPFVSYENGLLVIVGSETQVASSPVLQLEDVRGELWFPSLTNMMLGSCLSSQHYVAAQPYFIVRPQGCR